jgi:hypothetical protein
VPSRLHGCNKAQTIFASSAKKRSHHHIILCKGDYPGAPAGLPHTHSSQSTAVRHGVAFTRGPALGVLSTATGSHIRIKKSRNARARLVFLRSSCHASYTRAEVRTKTYLLRRPLLLRLIPRLYIGASRLTLPVVLFSHGVSLLRRRWKLRRRLLHVRRPRPAARAVPVQPLQPPAAAQVSIKQYSPKD